MKFFHWIKSIISKWASHISNLTYVNNIKSIEQTAYEDIVRQWKSVEDDDFICADIYETGMNIVYTALPFDQRYLGRHRSKELNVPNKRRAISPNEMLSFYIASRCFYINMLSQKNNHTLPRSHIYLLFIFYYYLGSELHKYVFEAALFNNAPIDKIIDQVKTIDLHQSDCSMVHDFLTTKKLLWYLKRAKEV